MHKDGDGVLWGHWRGYQFRFERERDGRFFKDWYIQVVAPDGCYAYDGWWKDSSAKPIREVVAEAFHGARLEWDGLPVEESAREKENQLLRRALHEIKLTCLTATNTSKAFAHIIRLCIDAGVRDTLPDLVTVTEEMKTKTL